jgi:predicted CXXCH cytochrome family protein
MVAGHPANPMSVTPDENLCGTCHKYTTDEWRASKHSEASIQCQACHDPHAQKPMATTVTELCTNCHKENSESFTHGTHAQAGLECSNCHMYTAPRETSPIGGLVPTGHTFSVGSEACIGCHQDTVHSRDEIVKLTGEVAKVDLANVDSLQKQVSEQESLITTLKQQSSVRLYTGLLQGAIIGLLTGSVTAWIVGQRIQVVEESENE